MVKRRTKLTWCASYYIAEDDVVTSIKDPAKKDFQYYITNNHRCNELHKEAFNGEPTSSGQRR